MKSKNIIILSLLATFLLSSSFISFVAADDDEPNLIATQDPPTTDAPDSSDNSTTSGDEILYTIQGENGTIAADDTQVPGAEDVDANLLATQKGLSSDNTLLLAAVATILAISVGGALGVFYYRKQAVKSEN
jgi:hypothetical protein